jgi:hypothetical protein
MGARTDEAAATAKVKPRTLNAWLAHVPAFKREIQKYRREATERALGLITDATCAAVLKVVSIMQNTPNERTALKAAEIILGKQLQMTELIALTERVEELEASHQTFNRPRVAS